MKVVFVCWLFRLLATLHVNSLPPEEGVGGARAKSRGRGRARGTRGLFRPSTVVWQAERRGRGERRWGAEKVLQEAAVAMATKLSSRPDSSVCVAPWKEEKVKGKKNNNKYKNHWSHTDWKSVALQAGVHESHYIHYKTLSTCSVSKHILSSTGHKCVHVKVWNSFLEGAVWNKSGRVAERFRTS